MTRKGGGNEKPRVGDDLVEAFNDMARYLRGEIEVDSYEIDDAALKAKNLDKAAGRKSSGKAA